MRHEWEHKNRKTEIATRSTQATKHEEHAMHESTWDTREGRAWSRWGKRSCKTRNMGGTRTWGERRWTTRIGWNAATWPTLVHSAQKFKICFIVTQKQKSLKMFIFLPWNRNLWRMFLFTKTRIFVHSPPFT